MEEKLNILFKLFADCDDQLMLKFLDLDSEKMLDDKIDVLSKLNAGVKPVDIKKYYDILELYPKEDVIWD